MSTPVLDIQSLSIQRDGTVILLDVSWRVMPGEHWVILGPNGCGKTSLLAALTGYFMPTSGDIDLLGERYGESDWRQLRMQVGIVSSSIRQMMADTEPALETVASGKHAMIDFWGKPSPADRRRALELLDQVECLHLEKRPWAVLSQGERQRVLIARALMSRPRLLILDEPCAGLDPVARELFLGFVERLATTPDGPSLVLVTHHVEEIIPCFTHALLLRSGEVVAAGPVGDALRSGPVSMAFGAPVRVVRRRGRMSLVIG
ncbi:MAG: ABC transporter ATP-binding protein [Verrucomicrobiota bacterium]